MGLNRSVIVFRTDASTHIGAGHVMRCLTLADSLRKRGADCHFICREQSGDLLTYIKRRGHQVEFLARLCGRTSDTHLGPSYASWLGTDQNTDALETRNIVDRLKPDWLIVDHYALDARWERLLKDGSRRLMIIDDLANRHHQCDLLLDQNLGRNAGSYEKLIPPQCKLLIGANFALLRPEFAELRTASLQRRRKEPAISSLLISLGGVDKDNATSTVVSALEDCSMPSNCRITIVVGSGYRWLNRLQRLASTFPREIKIVKNTEKMAHIMSQSDLAIGAGGVTGLERACLGLFSIVLETADNQRPFLSAFENQGLAVTAPGFQHLSNEEKRITIKRLFLEALKKENVAETIGSVCDGFGSERVANFLAGR